jgi:diguanylate cyclase (GGDEF)-like protein
MTNTQEPNELRALRTFHEVARAITSALELDKILRSILEQMAHYFKPETWSLLMLDEAARCWHYVLAAGSTQEQLAGITLPLHDGAPGMAMASGAAVMVQDITKDPRFANMPSFALPSRIRGPVSLLCIPVRARDKTLAMIQLVNSRPEGLNEFAMYFLNVLTDYTAIAIENAAAMERIRELTITDDCTGLFNARHLLKMLDAEHDRSVRSKMPFSLVFIDLDHFKLVNDTHGHLVGSQLLAEVGAVLRQELRNIDSAYRYGGDEFVALLPHTAKGSAIEVARRLFRSLRAHSFLADQGLEMHVEASFGLATFPDDGATVKELIKSADDMMYLVKENCRNNIAVSQMGIVGAE